MTRNPDQVRRVLGFMPDVFGVYDDMKVWEYLDFFGRCYGLSAATRRRTIGDLLELVDLADKRDDYVQTLSRGMEQRLCLAHALVHDPQVLLLDEPASGLDPRARVELRELLRELRTLGKTILISSHILPELEELCTSVAIVDRGQVLAQGKVSDIERRLRFGAVLRVRVLAEGEALEAARVRLAADPDVATAEILDDGTIELGFRGDDAASARLLARGRPRRPAGRHVRPGRERPRGALPPGDRARPRSVGRRVMGPGGRLRPRPAVVPADPDGSRPSTPSTSTRSRRPSSRHRRSTIGRGLIPIAAFRHTAGGIAAISVKELRGRMRGRRAFVILTLYLFLLAGFAWMVELGMEAAYSNNFGQSAAFASASIGQGIFAALIMLETLQVVFLAPASTAGAISLEREKQTLGLLVTTPISSSAIVLGKLLSALTYVFLLIAASIPLTAIVFVFGGVGPEDVVRAYVVLLVTALGLGAFGLCCSSLVKRTQAATAISIFGVLAITVGSVFVLIFWNALANDDNGQGRGPIKGQPPAIIAYVNPFLAQIDVMCGTESFGGTWCGILSGLIPSGTAVNFNDNSGGGSQPPVVVPLPAPAVPDKGVIVNGAGQVIGASGRRRTAGFAPDGTPLGGPVAADVTAFGVVRDAFWPRSMLTWLILTVVFLLISIQFVSPTRRWHLRRRRRPTPSPEAT